MNCDKCKSDMAQIPYIEHELRMAKAYEREKKEKTKNEKIKKLFIASNLFWFCVFVASILIATMR